MCECHTVLITVDLQYHLKSRSLIPPVPFFFFNTALAIRGLLCFHTNFKIFCSSSVKRVFVDILWDCLDSDGVCFFGIKLQEVFINFGD